MYSCSKYHITQVIAYYWVNSFRVTSKIDLFGGPSLGIFTNADKLEASTQTKTWENLQNRDLKLAVTQPPSNYFQQMILWTEQKKLWKFPIDNEQGIEMLYRYHNSFKVGFVF